MDVNHLAGGTCTAYARGAKGGDRYADTLACVRIDLSRLVFGELRGVELIYLLSEASPAEFAQVRSKKPRTGRPESGPNQKSGILCGDAKDDSWPGKTRSIGIFETDRILGFWTGFRSE